MNSTRNDFGRVENGKLVNAPRILKVQVEGQDGSICTKTLLHPAKEDYASASPPYFPVVEGEKPGLQPGHEIVLDHYDECTISGETVIVPSFTVIESDPGADPSIQHALKQYDNAMEQYLKSVREDRGYTFREPSDYALSQNERWHQDALDWIAFRDNVMEYAFNVMNSYQLSGTIVSLEDFMSGMPTIQWTFE